jgi:hypothetical protein
MMVVVGIVILLFAMRIWENNRSMAVCMPDDVSSYPLIPYMPALNVDSDDAKFYTFLEKYVKNVYDESITDYHRPTNLGRYNNAYLKTPLEQAIRMSDGEARVENRKKYANSDRVIEELRRCNCGWVFNIHAIESVNRVKANGYTYVTILGEFQETYDQVRVMLPYRLEGFYRLHLIVAQKQATKDEKGEFANEYGLYVISQELEKVSYDERQKLLNTATQKGFFVP